MLSMKFIQESLTGLLVIQVSDLELSSANTVIAKFTKHTVVNKNSYMKKSYHNATFPAIPKSIVAVTTPRALNTLRIVGIVML